MPEATAVGLDANLHETFAALLAHGLDPEDGRVGMGTDH